MNKNQLHQIFAHYIDNFEKLNDSINRNWSDSIIADVSELTKPDPDQTTMNESNNVLNTERVKLDPASITTKDYPKVNYEVTAKN